MQTLQSTTLTAYRNSPERFFQENNYHYPLVTEHGFMYRQHVVYVSQAHYHSRVINANKNWNSWHQKVRQTPFI